MTTHPNVQRAAEAIWPRVPTQPSGGHPYYSWGLEHSLYELRSDAVNARERDVARTADLIERHTRYSEAVDLLIGIDAALADVMLIQSVRSALRTKTRNLITAIEKDHP